MQKIPTCAEALVRVLELFAVAYVVFVLHYFWLAIFGPIPILVSVFAGSVLILTALRLGLVLHRRRKRDLLLFFSSFTMAIGVALARWSRRVDADVLHATAVRYWNSVDNKVPGYFARALVSGEHLRPLLFADWQSSDRPPLVSGFLLPLRSLTTNSFLEFLVLVLVSSLLVIVARLVIELQGIRSDIAAQVAICVYCAPGIFTNVIYTWPKIPSAALVLTAAAFATAPTKFRYWRELTGLAAALSFLAHGSSIFALIPLLILIARRETSIDVARILGCSAITYLPWYFYQHFFDPPGDRLLFWHLAGEISQINRQGIFSAVKSAYTSGDFSDVLLWKVHNFVNLLTNNFGNTAIAGYRTTPTEVTGWMQTTIPGSLGLAIVTIPVLLLMRARPTSKEHWTILKLAMMSIATLCVIEIGNSELAIASLHISSLATTCWILMFLTGMLGVADKRHFLAVLTRGMIIWVVLVLGLFHPSGAAAGWPAGELNWFFAGLAILSAAAVWFLVTPRPGEIPID